LTQTTVDCALPSLLIVPSTTNVLPSVSRRTVSGKDTLIRRILPDPTPPASRWGSRNARSSVARPALPPARTTTYPDTAGPLFYAAGGRTDLLEQNRNPDFSSLCPYEMSR
jgi:hypothetical protein